MSDVVKAAVIGHPIKHSKSPIIHKYWIEKHGLNGSYEAIDISPENLKDGIENLINEGYAGFNVTIPHKQSVMEMCDHLDGTALNIGAVNTVVIKNKKLHGFNTDGFGFIENIKHSAPKTMIKDKPSVILGAGGAARAVVYALLQEGSSEIRITNRSIEKAETLKEMAPSNIHVIPWEKREEALSAAGLLINTTSLGMDGQPPLHINLSGIDTSMTVCDIVYAPLMTPLLKQVEENENTIVTGIGMLLHQARPAFEHWFGVMPDIDETLMKRVLSA